MSETALFWIVVSAMLLGVCAALSVTLMKDVGGLSGRRTTQSLAAARALGMQIDEVRGDFAAGLIDEAGLHQAIEDIQRRALEEAGREQEQTGSLRKGSGLLLAPLFSVLIAGAAVGLYLHFGSPALLPFVDAYHASGIMQADGTLGEVKREVSAGEVEAFLADNPGNERAWVFLARQYAREDKWDNAERAYGRVMALGGFSSRDPQVMFEYAACLLGNGRQQSRSKAYEVLLRALALDEGNLRILEVVSMLEMETERWSAAREHLETFLGKLGMDNPSYERYAQMAAYAARMEREKEGAGR